MRLNGQEALQHNIIDLAPQQVHINADRLQMFRQRPQRPLMAQIVLLRIIILHKLLIFLINRIIRQIRKLVLLALIDIIRLRGEPPQAFIVDIHAQGVEGRHEHVQPQVEFEAVDQKGVLDVFGDAALLVDRDLGDFVDDVDAFPLRHVRRLDNPEVVLLRLPPLVESAVKIGEFVRQVVSIGDNVEFFF